MPTRHDERLNDLARRGAEARLREILEEASDLVKMFPPLKNAFDADELPPKFLLRRGADKAALTTAESTLPKKKPGRRRWTTAQRQAQAAKMKAYWAKRDRAR